jgi:hypothetical protein
MATAAVYVAEVPSKRKLIVHPKSMGSIAFLVTYIFLLWRSTSKQDSAQVILPKESFVALVTEVHKTLLKYVSNKALRGLSVTLILSKRVFGNVFQGPASLAADFISRQSAALQESLQGQFNQFLEKQLDALGEKTKEVVGDPYMPEFIHAVVDDVVDSLVPDAKRLILTKTNELIRYQSPLSHRRKIGHAIVLGPGPGYGRVKTKRELEAEAPAPREAFNLTAYIAHGREQVLEAVTLPYRWWYQTSQDKQTDAILEEIAAEPTNEGDDSSSDDEGEEEPDYSRWSLPHRVRARLLHISSPCDKSTWQCLRDWRWLLLTALGLAPYGIGTIWWLFMFALLEKRDEYQVCNFIVGFMTSKFLGGCGLLLYGASKYYLCSNRDVMTCAEDGPRVIEYYDGMLFFLQTLLVWLCFFILPMTHPCKYVLDDRHAYLVEDMDRVLGKLGTRRPRGGRLVQLFWWDSFCVFLVLGLALFAWGGLGQQGWQLRATLFWLKVLFGLLSMPFLLFKIPVLSTLLMQVRATGYDQWGRVVLHVRMLPLALNFNQDTAGNPGITRMDRQESLDEKVFEPLSDNEETDDEGGSETGGTAVHDKYT